MRRIHFVLKASASLTAISLAATTGPAAALVVVGALDGRGGVVVDTAWRGDDSCFPGGARARAQAGDRAVVQLDGILFRNRRDTLPGGAVHLGYRPAESLYLGAYGSLSDYRRASGVQARRLGGELVADFGKFRLSAVGGYEDIDGFTRLIASTATTQTFEIYERDSDAFAFSDLTWQGSDDGLAVSIGHRYTGGAHALALGTAIPLANNVAITGQVRLGEREYTGGLLGLRIVFGKAQAPARNLLTNRLVEDLFAAGNVRRTRTDILPPPPPPPPDECGSCGGYCD
ncbi:MAG: hypothetical protein ACK4RT_09470 [Erythrobacter sp.]